MYRYGSILLLAGLAAASLAFLPSCADEEIEALDAGFVDAGRRDGGGGDAGTEPDCYENPVSHLELINGCSDAERVEKNPVLPLLRSDGTRPPLP